MDDFGIAGWPDVLGGRFHARDVAVRPGVVEIAGDLAGVGPIVLWVRPAVPGTRAFVETPTFALGYTEVPGHPVRDASGALGDVLRALASGTWTFDARAVPPDPARRDPVSGGSLPFDALTLPLDQLLQRLPAEASAPGSGLALDLRLPTPCCEACLFCAGGPPRTVAADRPSTLAGIQAFCREVLPALVALHRDVRLSLSAGDVLRDPDLAAILAALDAVRGVRVTVQTPGTALCDPAVIRALAGTRCLTCVGVTRLGATAAVHDAVAGRAGAFDELQRGLQAARPAGIPLVVSMVLVAANAGDLRAVATQCLDRGERLTLRMPVLDTGAVAPRFPALLVPLNDVRRRLNADLPLYLRALDLVCDLPLCAAPPALRSRVTTSPSRPARFRAHPATCDRCALVASCPGVDTVYVETFGERGLVAQAAATSGGS